MCRRIQFTFAILFFLLTCKAFAGERDFTYTYQSHVLQKGQREIEIWNTIRSGKADYFRAIDYRLEFEMGLTNKLQTSFYLNLGSKGFQSINEKTVLLNNTSFVSQFDTSIEHSMSLGISNEWKYKLSDPVANVIGSALYGEISIEHDELELESKIILDKKMGKFFTAFNAVGELELETELENAGTEVEMEKEFKLEFDYGLSYNLGKNFNLGFELRNHNVLKDGDWEHSALFAGPCMSFKADNYWFALTILPQVHNFKYNGLELAEYEKCNARLLFAYLF